MKIEMASKTTANPIHITIPVNVAYSPDLFKRSIAGLVEQLGCTKCFSGFDCRISMERDFVVDPAAKVVAASTKANFVSRAATQGNVSVSLGTKTAFSIDAIYKAIDRISDLTGCPCHSGLDISFQRELEQFRF